MMAYDPDSFICLMERLLSYHLANGKYIQIILDKVVILCVV